MLLFVIELNKKSFVLFNADVYQFMLNNEENKQIKGDQNVRKIELKFLGNAIGNIPKTYL